MAEANLMKLALAQRQLETAIGLFVSRRDRISAITLAGAADGILHGLVLRAGKQPFADYALAIGEAMTGQTPSKAKYAKHINDTLNINDLKHMDGEDAEEVMLDVDISALGAILKAVANHHILVPDNPDFIKAMLQWTWKFYDGKHIQENDPFTEPAGKKMMMKYENRSNKVKRVEERLSRNIQSESKKNTD